MEDLLHELIGGEGHSLGGDTADVVEGEASVQSLLNPIAVVHIRQGLGQRPVGKRINERVVSSLLVLWRK